MKKTIFTLSLILMLVLSSTTVFAQNNEIIVAIDSEKVEFTEESGHPFVDENSRTLVPFRKALESYGATVDWNNDERIAIAEKDEIKVEVPIDQSYILVNGEQKATDTQAKIVNGRTYLPIRAVIEAFGSSVEWDASLKTVVITTTPVDAKAIFTEANNKSIDWKNYDADVKVDISLDVPDAAGSVQTMNMKMNMYMTLFVNPMKAKINADMLVNIAGQEMSQPFMNMYMTIDENGMNQYMSMDNNGTYTWMKQTIANEMFGDLLKYDEEAIEKNKETAEKYTKDVKYFGKYKDKDRTLLRLEYTMSGEIYKDMLGESLENMPAPTNEQEEATYEALKALVDGNFGDTKYIVYIDEETKEIVKYEMDLGTMIQLVMGSMTDLLGEMPQEVSDMLKSMKATMVMEVLNVNHAEDFEIPEEALNAPEMNEYLEQLSQEAATEETTEEETTEETETEE
ncbi:copper amine oxidase N-terminal domain-containing protein [Sedimentibacter hydroxybenzoicus DSM 7310]|uniref:Copper amine oxidase N-terminal domain-containing protein n=1 Tax=Sedimentibacter hydroxybenzoicus DSM 7310 TaxID=1123245 RepID=A0A974GUS9_SEDHY|nr:copper amine oxidase N-terminal domain-containing protein [Sedimentibacter hydroxybenzoicus]NYB72534.1 copper amine oxidase N-terminal domain-containing protein [Sedimentibacter hydroxybenzoicus DSM 7310]